MKITVKAFGFMRFTDPRDGERINSISETRKLVTEDEQEAREFAKKLVELHERDEYRWEYVTMTTEFL